MVRVVEFDRLTARELDAWHALRAGNPSLDSPYFHPEFAAAVHAAGPAVRVAVAENAKGAVVGLFPLHVNGSAVRPAGWPAADFQAPIQAEGGRFPVEELLPALRARTFAFDHLLGSAEFERWIETRRASPYLDVTGGLEGYLARASRSGKDNMGQARRRSAKAAREHGSLVFTASCADPAVLDEVIRLKREQYAATGARDYFSDPARIALLHRLLRTREGSFRGVLSTVHIGGELLAAHFGIQDGHVLHWWFPVYDPRFARLAPGWILLREIVRAAPETGVQRIDLGRGEDEYKRRAMTGEVLVCQGEIASGELLGLVRRAGRQAVTVVKGSPIAPQLRSVLRRFR
ncbi:MULTISPECIES: GNAT family N-acetyltransferase [unclassified Amycolatopsis]|uniref:GNAT family N-acetyltransferase n=1 Tax=unclassified Amycolatopsis TaxID=2618356 RepID=UPI001F0E7323|nr:MULTISPECIES: GNAT family N-acetyltransferase [unclassified Amycolatopsis]